MQGVLHGTPCAFGPGRCAPFDASSWLATLRCTLERCLLARHREADPSDVPSPSDRCAPCRALRDRESSFSFGRDRRLRPPREERTARVDQGRLPSNDFTGAALLSETLTMPPRFAPSFDREIVAISSPCPERVSTGFPAEECPSVRASDASQRRDAARSILFRASISRGGWVTISRLRRRDSPPDVVSLRGFPPSSLAGRCSASVSLRVARSGATSSFDFCRTFDRGHHPQSRA
jgi:hypothetical protein